ncbi:GTPase Der [Operophtera brumata]|uniref:GTPase Der n=1 Tax=Operophtera brumata TaxID=104452 RepID=A0A0L7KUM9_OPEBR|nr:GTPase Der [Operophtera brumata]
MSTKEWEKLIDKEMLISLVEDRPVLWDKTLDKYKDNTASIAGAIGQQSPPAKVSTSSSKTYLTNGLTSKGVIRPCSVEISRANRPCSVRHASTTTNCDNQSPLVKGLNSNSKLT